MTFNPGLLKQAQDVISRKTVKISHPFLTFDKVPVACTICQKRHKGIGIMKRLSNIFPRNSLLIVYKSFMRLHSDYCDIIYDQPNNEKNFTKIECMQHNAALSITGATKGTSRTKLYKELGLESLKVRRWFRRLCTLFKIKFSGTPEYFFNRIPTVSIFAILKLNLI